MPRDQHARTAAGCLPRVGHFWRAAPGHFSQAVKGGVCYDIAVAVWVVVLLVLDVAACWRAPIESVSQSVEQDQCRVINALVAQPVACPAWVISGEQARVISREQ